MKISWKYQTLACLCIMSLVLAGCGSKPASKMPQNVAVKAMQVIQQDTPVTYEFIGQVEPREEVQIRANVTGRITEKWVQGGDQVTKGQPLFRIDSRNYASAQVDTQAQLAEAEASLAQVHRDVIRYQSLVNEGAVSQQTYDNLAAQERQAQARVEAYQAKVQQAGNNVEDTVVVSPLTGRIDLTDLSVGNYVKAGETTLGTVSTVDPVRVKFSVSENEYLKFARKGASSSANSWDFPLTLILSDGSQYSEQGRIELVDRGLSASTGTLTLKAAFNNPQKILVPGMFARIQAIGEVRPGALLVPQRAVQELFGKTFVTVVGAENKAESRPVKMGPRVGNLWIVESGLSPADQVVVEGFMKAQPGTPLEVTIITLNDLIQTEQK